MGHYYSEMVSDDELKKLAQRRKEHRAAMRKKLKAAIKKHGIEEVLIDIIENDGWRYRR